MKSTITSLCIALLLSAAVAWAQTDSYDANDPPTRIARLAFLQGGVSFRPAGAEEWVDPGENRPLTVGDQLWSDRDGRIEVQLDGSNVRLGSQTAAGLLNLTDENTQIQLSSGSMIVHVQQLGDDESYEIDTPTVAFSILRAGTYRLTVDPSGQSTAIAVRSGQGEAVGGDGVGYTIRAGEYQSFSGTDQVEADNLPMAPQDEFDGWSAERDNRDDHSESAQYVSPDVVGYEDLDNQGNWDDTPEYGHVWFPTGLEAGWAPYHYGHWAYIAPWGYTWVDDRAWGFAPFHYGRWVYWRQRWGWVPAPPRAPNVVYVRPVYAPALVAWVGSGATLGWFPLGPREVFVPSYPVSRRYLNVVNVSNTRVNTAVINNVYNTTIINRTTINNGTYANRSVPGAVAATSRESFSSARPVRGDRGGGDTQALQGAPVRAFAPPVVPARAAVFGGRSAANIRPPAAVQARVTAARMAPAAAPPNLDQRLQALRDHRGRLAQSARAPGQGSAPATVRVVPPVHTLVNSRQLENARSNAPQAQPTQPGTGTRPPVHASELPAAPRGPSPGTADSVLARQQAQEQQRLQASQEAERQRMAQEQELEHRRLSQQSPDQRTLQLNQQRAAQDQAQAQAQAELQRSRQVQAQQADQQRAQQLQQQRQLDEQVQQQRAVQLEQQQRAERADQQRQVQVQAQAQQQAQEQRNQQLERQRDAQQAQQRQQQDAQRQQTEAQRERERQIETQHQQQTQQLQQQQARAQQEMLQRQQAAQAEQQQREPVHRPPPPNQRQP